jgi:outer membrane protein OmpA-like peptidoglycan-associated protein/tetratricopeptide (TPR) repeat protein
MPYFFEPKTIFAWKTLLVERKFRKFIMNISINIKYLFFLLLLSLSMISLNAQNYTTTKTAAKKAQKQYSKARDFVRARDFDKSLKALEKALENQPDFINAILLRASIQFDQKDYQQAEKGFQKATQVAPDYDNFAWFQLGVTQWKLKKFEQAAAQMKRFLKGNIRQASLRNEAERYLQNASFAAKAVQNPVAFDPEPLSAAINTNEADETLPIPTADGRTLIYTRRFQRQEDLFFSLKADGKWQPGQPVPGVNTPTLNEGAQSISADGKTIVFTVCNRRGDFGSCDLYLSERIDGRWTQPQNMGPTINTPSWESQPALSSDGRLMYFASDRAGGQGKRDVWYSLRQKNGEWTQPVNLGSTINTGLNDQAPFIHPDGVTLYFMSDGHPGMGGSDLFLARKAENNDWEKPQNLGFPINTEANEGAISISLDGQTAYFTSDQLKTGQRDNDLYTFEMPTGIRPKLVTYVKAKVVEQGSAQPLIASVELTDLNSGQLFANTITDRDGTFLICLPSGNNYALNVEKKGYAFYSENFALEEGPQIEEPFLIEVELIPIPKVVAQEESPEESSTPIVLKNVFFATGSAQLLDASQQELNRLHRLLTDNPNMRIRINGHTDDVGSEANNQVLSENRARAVYEYLIEEGIEKERLSYKGFGESQPIADNDTEEGRQQNRRTEFIILK